MIPPALPSPIYQLTLALKSDTHHSFCKAMKHSSSLHSGDRYGQFDVQTLLAKSGVQNKQICISPYPEVDNELKNSPSLWGFYQVVCFIVLFSFGFLTLLVAAHRHCYRLRKRMWNLSSFVQTFLCLSEDLFQAVLAVI